MNDADALFHRAIEVMPGGNTRSTLFVNPHPPYAVKGQGASVVDAVGHRSIDCNNNYTALIHGHADPEILSAAMDAAARGTAFGLPTSYEIEMAELLSTRTGLQRWRFCNSGTEAVMMLIRGARAHTGRDLVVRFDGSYHGTYDGVVASDAPGVPDSVAAASIVLPQNDLDELEATMRQYGDRVAVILLDLMPNRAGLQPVTREFAMAARTLSTAYGALLAIDEVITFRLGAGGLHQSYDITPDVVSLGKIIGGGFPVGAIGGRADVLDAFSPLGDGPVAWGGTFSANPVTMAAGLAALHRFPASSVATLNAKGNRLRDRLVDAGLTVNGSGSLLRLIVDDATAMWWRLYEAGVLVGTNGLLALSTAMSDEDIDLIASRVINTIRGRYA
ncbi:aspartate aminotransferase family protein [Mycolicibacterium komossense]|uniref:Aminotransferase class III-fold pyridoxal phosphate-dependent enzyme n=1 Tax=Mycolicibacterium komossense TaxID=1779 RepID=A0ABT3CBW0_9MYCO|nr:aminotransferase class III-fold pyridoxal phosphate-dependent enzyme [Mycolicibacterium komossense]MCV7226974.1 aminotransferase class III-fold pyridoxal phosphate-dependent enzyme [Mycolicibacterium komossense]